MIFAQNCASWHGDQGVIGPALIGPNGALPPYGTGRGLYDFVSTNMPQSAPGSLSPDHYLQLVSFILVRNNFTSDQAPRAEPYPFALPHAVGGGSTERLHSNR